MKTRGGSFSPTLAVSLTIAWLLLNETLAPAQIVLGAVLAVALTWASSSLRPLGANIKRLDAAVVLLAIVFVDIVRSNLSVARIVLGLVRNREVRSGFLDIPLNLRDPHGLAVLAGIITSTPGTVWVGVSPDGGTLTLHVLDLRDEKEWVRTIKQRYEAYLMRIFE
ncbi:MAG TPA: Na+/H+ antiporter subunit E [Steroidobacter sp.]